MTLKIALVGTGNVAKRNYVPCLSDQEDVELGYYNRTRTKAEAIAEEFGGAVFDSLEALTAWNPDSIFVLTRETERRAVIAALLALKPRRRPHGRPRRHRRLPHRKRRHRHPDRHVNAGLDLSPLRIDLQL